MFQCGWPSTYNQTQLLTQLAMSTDLNSYTKMLLYCDSHGVSGVLGGSLTERRRNIDQVELKKKRWTCIISPGGAKTNHENMVMNVVSK